MKNYLMILGIISLFLVAACAQQPTDQDSVVGQGTPVGGSDSSMAVPAPENGDVEEMVVNEDEAADEDAMAVSDVFEIDMTAKQWEFDPGTITVKEGQKVKLNIKSIDVTHGFALPDFGVSQRLEPGKTEIVEFTADKKGTYTFFCSVVCGSGHRSMKGILVVE